jgi:hypothetical protein
MISKIKATLVLKAALVVMGLLALAFAAFALPYIYKGGTADFPYATNAILGITIVLYAVVLLYLYVLLQSWQLLVYIDRNIGFSKLSVVAFRHIKYAAFIGGMLLILVFVPLLYPIAEEDDAPGLLLYGFMLACVPFVVSVFAGVLEQLFQNAVEIKSENDLTV